MRGIFALFGIPLLLAGFVTPGAQSRPDVTFTKDIKPLIDRKCVTCHVKGGSAPFPLQTYAQIKKRGDLCRRMILTKSMPPCASASPFGEFCEGGGPFSDEEMVVFQNWMDAGAPEGATSEPAATPDLKTWKLGKPSLVLRPAVPFDVKEEGRPYWRAVVIPLGQYEGRRLKAFDFHVDQPQAIRSITLAIARPGLMGTRRAVDGWETSGTLDIDAKKTVGQWSPGYSAWTLPEGISMTLDGPALVVQALYMPRGKTESGNFEVGLYLSNSKSDIEPQWLDIGYEEFSVPAPGSLVLRPQGQLPKNSRLLAVFPEARFFCTSVRLSADGKLLFYTRRWEPYWQGPSRFEEPIEFPTGAKVEAEFNYDNDIHMGRNEGRRPRPILPGLRERDELCRMHLLYVVDRKAPKSRDGR